LITFILELALQAVKQLWRKLKPSIENKRQQTSENDTSKKEKSEKQKHSKHGQLPDDNPPSALEPTYGHDDAEEENEK
jgi:hypothetical protein